MRNWKIYSEQGRYAISNYASEASPTLGCSIEISWDIVCVCRFVYVCLGNPYKTLYAKMRGWDYVIQTHACSKSVLGDLNKVPLGILNSTFIRPVKTDL